MRREEPDVHRSVHGSVRGEEQEPSTLLAVWEGDTGHHVGGPKGFQFSKKSRLCRLECGDQAEVQRVRAKEPIR